ncbi:MAG: hypothetical protein RLO51_02380 [Thalassobaculum sp.]|uniref:DUF6629 family protein n=1 Tax=Thalassobaculum sp. TaxID=2022740 RepID=UPI0032EB3344
MCFSATASFLTAGATGAIGIACLVRAGDPRELLLAATPLVFAAQQAVEGLLWLTLPQAPDGAVSSILTLLFLLIAEVFWPVYAPLAALLVETDARRRRPIALCLAAGIAVAAWLLWAIVTREHSARLLEGHIVYSTGLEPSALVGFGYLAATAGSLLLSTRRTVALLGVMVLAGSVVTYLAYWDAFVSVWCYFAAASSLVLLGHFEWSHRHRGRTADA